MSSWIDQIAAKLSPELVGWARTQPDLATAWTSCPRVEWLIDLGTTLPLDETSRRALARAAAEVISDGPTFLRLVPAAHQIAAAWATRRNAGSLDVLGTMRFQDYQNGIVAVLPVVLAVMLVLQYGFHAPHAVLQGIRVVAVAALPGSGVVWGFARRRLTDRAIRHYGPRRLPKDVFDPVRELARRLPDYQAAMLSKFRRGWQCVTESPAPRLSAS